MPSNKNVVNLRKSFFFFFNPELTVVAEKVYIVLIQLAVQMVFVSLSDLVFVCTSALHGFDCACAQFASPTVSFAIQISSVAN